MMPFDLPISEQLKRARGKVKVGEKESRERPHVTIFRGTMAWRIDLRIGEFMDRIPDPADISEELLTLIYKRIHGNNFSRNGIGNTQQIQSMSKGSRK